MKGTTLYHFGFSSFAVLLQISLAGGWFLLRSSSYIFRTPLSRIVNTKWNIRLDVGLESDTWMPRRHPGWAESGARLGLDVTLYFSDEECREDEPYVGPFGNTFNVDVVQEAYGGCSSKFVSAKGLQKVSFTGGGWYVDRPVRLTGGSSSEKGMLNFWLDCPSGAKRNDVEIVPHQRIFFRTGIWDDTPSQQGSIQEYKVQQIEELVSRGERESLSPTGAPEGRNGVKLSPKGSMAIKGKTSWLPAWEEEYLILGTFTPKGVLSK